MTAFFRSGVLAILLGVLITLWSAPASAPDAVPVFIGTSAAAEASAETAADAEISEKTLPSAETASAETEEIPPAAESDALPETEAAETESVPEIPPAYPVSSIVPMTGALPVITIREEAPAFEAELCGGRIVLPSLIGWYESDAAKLSLPSVQIEFAYDWYPLPAGVIYAASFTGELSEEEFRVLPDTALTLHVSRGMGPYVSVLTEESRTVYLTFDDGPHRTNTESILDTLDEYGIKATFFTVGRYVDTYPEIVREISERGHKIGCHSYSHSYSSLYASTDSMMAEMEKWENAVAEAIGYIPPERLFRYPGGSTNCRSSEIYDAVLRAGYRVFDWNALTNDCLLHTRPAEVGELDFMKESLMETVAYSFRLKKSPHIILMHDSYAQTAELLPWVIEYLQSLGCTFATPDELPAGWLY